MITNKHPQRMSQRILSLFASSLRVLLSSSALAAVVLLFLAASSEPASAKEDVAAPPAAFAAVTANPAAKSPVQFTGASQPDAMSWHWDFGDGKTSASQDPVHAFANPGDYPVALTVTTPHGSVTSSQIVSVTASETLRIISSHPFDVTLSAADPRTGATGQGQVISQTDIYGLFSIPDITGNAGNPEVIVKMVDASGIGQSYWVFFGALTDLTYTLTVTEVATGHTKTYHNAQVGSTVCGQFDTSGFDFIPTPTPPAPTPTPTAPPAVTPTPTPTAPAKIVVNLVATEFEWNFNGAGPNFTMQVGQTYELHISDGDRAGLPAHGFGGVPGLGIPARGLTAGGPATIVTITPNASQVGTFAYACNMPSCGIGHGNMFGTIRVVS
ncbi:MAG TPA: PKD domain-containing protein [Thermoanaerobaculia bacterium]|nr:PKD domain-containing protein [Thermoanaerobaculia bacterium]